MLVIIFIEAVIISAFFDQQGRHHKLELEIEYEKLGKRMPVEPPKLPMLESIMNIIIGLILAEIGGVGLWAFLGLIKHADQIISQNKSFFSAHFFATEVDFISALLAGGIALMILGVKSVRANLKSRKTLLQSP